MLSLQISRPNSPLIFQLKNSEGVPVDFPNDTAQGRSPVMVTVTTPWLTEKHLMEFKPFSQWCNRALVSLAEQRPKSEVERFWLRSIVIQAVDIFHWSKSCPDPSVKKLDEGTWPGGVKDGRIGFVKMQVEVSNGQNENNWLSGAVFLRGPSVAMMVIFHVKTEENGETVTKQWVPLTVQPRMPAGGNFQFPELPAGMLDGSDNFAGAAARELEEEAGMIIPQGKLVNLTKLANDKSESSLAPAMYPSPGGCDEYIEIYLYQQELSPEKLGEMKGKVTGIGDERITLHLVELDSLWREGGRDSKALAAALLFEKVSKFYPESVKEIVSEADAKQYTETTEGKRAAEQEESKTAEESKRVEEAKNTEECKDT